MNAGEIIRNHIVSNGYHGLFNEAGECGCPIDDLALCGHCAQECEPAYAFACHRCHWMHTDECNSWNSDFDVLYTANKSYCSPWYFGEDE